MSQRVHRPSCVLRVLVVSASMGTGATTKRTIVVSDTVRIGSAGRRARTWEIRTKRPVARVVASAIVAGMERTQSLSV